MVFSEVVVSTEMSEVVGARFFKEPVRNGVVFVAALCFACAPHESAGRIPVGDELFECSGRLVRVGCDDVAGVRVDEHA